MSETIGQSYPLLTKIYINIYISRKPLKGSDKNIGGYLNASLRLLASNSSSMALGFFS